MTERATTPCLSIVLATDEYQTIRPVLAALSRQSCASELEPVIVLFAESAGTARPEDLKAFPHAQVITDGRDLAEARAAGVRAASAPFVFIGETHVYPQPGWAEALIASFDQPYAAVVPAIGNANPTGAPSWASYLFDYGAWGPSRRSGGITDPLIYNTAYRREVLLSLGDSLPMALNPSEETLWPLLWSKGHRAAFASQARILHLNVGTLGKMIHEKFCVGVVLGMHRSDRWAWSRRLLYLFASPLIPLVLFVRVLRNRRHWPAERLPWGTMPIVLMGAIAKTAGEVAGYAGLKLPAAAAKLQDIEIRKVQYAARVG